MNLRQGTTLERGKYRIDSVLGQGGFGITYLGEQIYLGRKVAIKEFFIESYCERDSETSQISVPTANNKALVERFRRKFIKEAQNIASLTHRCIVPVIDVFEENGTAYYVMDYLEGGSLNAVLKQGLLQEETAVKYIRDIASALAEVHSHNILHLDVKPANIMLNSKDEAVLIDFGISKRYDEGGSQTSSMIGGFTEGYAPIEQYESGELNNFSAATDIYSLGATFYRMVTGNMPPKATEVYNDGLPALPGTLSAGTRAAIEAAMQPRRKDRPQSIEEFLALLDGGGNKVIVENVVEEHEKEASNKKVIWIVSAVVFSLAIIAAVLFGVFSGNDSDVVADAAEQYHLGHRYYSGDGVEQSFPDAVKWWQLSAEQGYAAAQYYLGSCYFSGEGVAQSYEAAAKWWRLSANQNYAAAQCWLGFCYENGRGVAQSHDNAVKWYRKSAEQGHADAQCNLGNCYANGHGVPQSYSEAVKWFRKAADQGYARAQFNLGVCYKNGHGVPQSYSEAVKWYRKAADQGDADAQCNLGNCYANGHGVSQSYSEAAKWFRKAADQGHARAKKALTRLGY